MGPCAHCGKPITIPSPPPHQRWSERRARWWFWMALMLLAAGAAAVLLVAGLMYWPTLRINREVAPRMQCLYNLQQIALAMRQYESVNGSFPPAYVADQQGNPLYSWRVLLLPYLGYQDLYDRFRLNESWNSPANRPVSDLTLDVFQCPAQSRRQAPTTNYLMVVGPHTIAGGGVPRRLAEIVDGLANTILVVESADSDIHWAEPSDLPFDQLDFTINHGEHRAISSHHAEGANAAFCDGSARLLKNSISPSLIRAMLTIDGAETIPPPDF
ncbi:MAG: DUF1559 domain-containing protein [Planctomycetaceae bacterium]|nr:DUF1559 domain-containing protein [Planctomycetaceae bacterium]